MHLVAASGTIGLEYREGMCRLEFSVCVVMGGGGELMWQLNAIHNGTTVLLCLIVRKCSDDMCSDES